MPDSLILRATSCAICGNMPPATELYPANFEFEAFSPTIFSARRLPDRIHGRIVRCDTCGLVRSDPVANDDALAALYRESTFDYDDEVANLQRTYGRYLAKLEKRAEPRASLLEVGCGNGFFLEEALHQGYKDVRGVEPSHDAVARAAPAVQGRIVCDVMRPGLFADAEFDVVCLFQVFDHLSDPVAVLKECFRVLKPGGVLLCLNHNVEALSARVLKEKSPIIDLEHTYLYSPATMKKIVAQHGFVTARVETVYNTYSLHYLARLFPFPRALKQLVLKALSGRVGRAVRLSVPLGNLCLYAAKPTDARSSAGAVTDSSLEPAP